ncbi:uncharacterized protein LOC132717427 isoform X1 [Ruditapes philippinarum]|uniref:uncharacterized protein LOC132717427 isoform X1 n=1 Tax=Ruditapes philippinarum TaxID=129788 RepID=UPI00295B9B43|nr:uncharacterized protein LOC132717427 isoform X1 [Ruditapes philippinarum]
MFPTHYTHYSNAKDVHQHGGSQLWTGMFKTNIVYKYDSYIPAERREDKKFYGYLTKTVEDGVKLQFTEVSSRHRRLCDDGKEVKNEKSTRSTAYLTTIDGNGKEVKNENSSLSTASPPTMDGNAENSSAKYVIIGVCVSVLLLSLIIVSLACFYRHRMTTNVSSQAHYISPTFSTRIYENNVTVTDNDRRGVQNENSDLTSQHYYATPTEIHYEQNQELQSFRNATREVNHKEDHDTEELTNTGAYESLQERK